MKVGKSTVARLLAARLGLTRRGLDKNRWIYYAEIAFDAAHARELTEREGLESALNYCKPFEVHAVERHLAENRDCVIDFGAGYSAQDDPALQDRVIRALAPHPCVVLLLPFPEPEKSIAYLDERVDQNLRDVNAHYVRHPLNRALAKATVYTAGKTPEDTCEEILQAFHLDPPK